MQMVHSSKPNRPWSAHGLQREWLRSPSKRSWRIVVNLVVILLSRKKKTRNRRIRHPVCLASETREKELGHSYPRCEGRDGLTLGHSFVLSAIPSVPEARVRGGVWSKSARKVQAAAVCTKVQPAAVCTRAQMAASPHEEGGGYAAIFPLKKKLITHRV